MFIFKKRSFFSVGIEIAIILCILQSEPSAGAEITSDDGRPVKRTLYEPRRNIGKPSYAPEESSSSDKENAAKRSRIEEQRFRKLDPTFRKANPANAYHAAEITAIKDNLNRPSVLTSQVSYVGIGKGTGDSKTFSLTPSQMTNMGYIKDVDIKGHMLGARLGGNGKKDFIFPQNKEINNAAWKVAEGRIATNIKEFGPATVKTTLTYQGNNVRCSGITCEVSRSNGISPLRETAPNPTSLSDTYMKKQAARASAKFNPPSSTLSIPKSPSLATTRELKPLSEPTNVIRPSGKGAPSLSSSSSFSSFTSSRSPKDSIYLARDLLDTIYKNRHTQLVAKINGLDQVTFENTKNSLLSEINTKLPKQGKLRDAQLIQRQQILDLSLDDFKSKLITSLDNSKKFDTIAVHLSQKEKYVVIAANTKTRQIDDWNNLEMWKSAAAGLKSGGDVMFSYKEFGIQAKDALSIDEVLKKPEFEKWSPKNDFHVEVLIPEQHKVNKEIDSESKKTQQKLEMAGKKQSILVEEYDKKIKLETNEDKMGVLLAKKKNSQLSFDKETLKIKMDLSQKIQKLQTFASDEPHAEIQLIAHQKTNSEFQAIDAVISPSKAPCKKCERVISKTGLYEGDAKTLYGGPGLAKGRIRNWDPVDKIQILSKSLEELTIEIKNRRKTSELQNTCSRGRKKRATSSSCVFVISSEDSVGNLKKSRLSSFSKNDVEQVRSKEFLTAYTKTTDLDARNKLVHAVEENQLRLVGSPEEIGKAKKVIDYETMVKHSAKLEYSLETMTSGEKNNGKGKFYKYTKNELLSGTKLSPTQTKLQISKRMKKFTKKVGKVTRVAGNVLLAKHIVSGIQNGDTTSLAIIGGRVGGEVGLSAISTYGPRLATKIGTKLGIKAFAKGASSTMKFIGKAAGPLGTAVDIGLSGWSLSKSISQLNDPNSNKFQQNDAIASIVESSTDIAITLVVAGLSLLSAFAPLAPIFAAVGFLTSLLVSAAVTLYKAHNHVDSLNEGIPLLGYERAQEIERYRSGKETSDYILDLIKTKHANNLAVRSNIAFLNANAEYIGRVFPSRTFKFKGACSLTKQYCSFGRKSDLLCWNWEDKMTVATSCYGKGGKCDDYSGPSYHDGTCITEKQDVPNENGHDHFECDCNGETQTEYGRQHEDSKVDLRSKQTIFLERAVPDQDSSYDVFCRPSSTSFQGDKISMQSSSYGYLCKNAIGLRRWDGSGEFMSYELGIGSDEIYLNEFDKTNNHFTVDDGHKRYFGSIGQDTFIISGPCNSLRGILDGGNSGNENSLVINPRCLGGRNLLINLQDSKIQGGYEVDLEIKNIKNIQGRQNEGDEIRVSCESNIVDGGGGRSLELVDDVLINSRKSSDANCTFSTTIIARRYTHVFTKFTKGQVIVIIPPYENEILLSHFDENLKSEEISNSTTIQARPTAQTLFYFPRPIYEIFSSTFDILNSTTCRLSMKLSNNESVQVVIGRQGNTYEQEPELRFVELDGSFTNIIISVENGGMAYHRIDNTRSERRLRKGALGLPNLFEIESGHWELIGGNRDDVFKLIDIHFNGTIDGYGGDNGIHFNTISIEHDIIVDLIVGELKCIDYFQTFKNIQRIIGRAGKNEYVKCGCDTSFISIGGGISLNSPDVIDINNNNNCERDLTIVAPGFTKVTSQSLQGRLILVVPMMNNTHLTYHSNHSQANSILNIGFPVSQMLEIQYSKIISTNKSYSGYEILILGPNELKIQTSAQNTQFNSNSSEYLNEFQIQFEELYGSPSSISIHRKNGTFATNHQLDLPLNTSSPPQIRTRLGTKHIKNYFELISSQWRAIGGDEDDEFLVRGYWTGEIVGGKGENTIYLDTGFQTNESVVKVDIPNGLITTNIIFSDVGRLFGRSGKSDHIICDCNTTFVSGLSGSDHITVPSRNNSCEIALTVVATGTTKVVNAGGNSGILQIHVSQDTNKSIQFVSELLISKDTKSTLIFRIPMNFIEFFEFSKNEDGHYLINMEDYKLRNVKMEFGYLDQNQSLDGPFLTEPEIIFVSDNYEIEGQLLLDPEKNEGLLVSILDSQKEQLKIRRGGIGIPNLFKLIGKVWEVYGGQKDDTFILESDNFRGHLSGNEGLNTLQLSNELKTPTIYIDLINNTMSLLKKDEQISIEGLQIVYGRSEKEEIVRCGCNTVLVDGHGGRDFVNIEDLNCTKDMNMTIFVHSNGFLYNKAKTGDFKYLVSSPDRINVSTFVTKNTNHFYQFQFGFNEIIQSTKFQQSTQILSFKIQSGADLSYKMFSFENEEIEFTNPILQFIESDFIRADVRVRKNGVVYSSIKIGGEFNSSQILKGIPDVENGFLFDAGPNSSFNRVVGRNLNDSFWLNSVGHIHTLDGGPGGTNSLNLDDDFYQNDSLVVDLNAGIYLEQNLNVSLVDNLKNIHILRCRSDDFERVFVAPNTKIVSDCDEVWVTQTNSSNYDLNIIIDNGTIVYFPIDDFNSEFGGGKFYYRFQSLRSFDVNRILWSSIRKTKHLFYLRFNIEDLEDIFYYKKNSKLSYKIQNQTYSHSIDPFLEIDQQFFSSPELMSQDGFHIRVSRQGEIFMTLNIDALTTLYFIQTEVIEKYGQIAHKLKSTLIIQTKTDFLYFGHNGTTNEVPNILTNTESRSHLIGGGTENTVYVILDLSANVYIYPGDGANNANLTGVQTIDLTEIIFKVRNEMQAKYLPKITQSVAGDIEIIMDGFVDEFPGKIVIVSGIEYISNFQILCNAVVLSLTQIQNGRQKRSLEEDPIFSSWTLKPNPILIPRGSIFALSAEDFEIGQEILTAINETFETTNISQFVLARDGDELIFSNLPTVINSTNEMITFVLLNFYNEANAFNVGLSSLENLRLNVGNWTNLNLTQLNDMRLEDFRDWEDILEESEELYLAEIPEILERKFRLPIWKRIWKRHRYIYYIGFGVITGILILVFLKICLPYCLSWRFTFVVNKTKDGVKNELVQSFELAQITNKI